MHWCLHDTEVALLWLKCVLQELLFPSFFFTVGFVHSMQNNKLASDYIVLDQIDTNNCWSSHCGATTFMFFFFREKGCLRAKGLTSSACCSSTMSKVLLHRFLFGEQAGNPHHTSSKRAWKLLCLIYHSQSKQLKQQQNHDCKFHQRSLTYVEWSIALSWWVFTQKSSSWSVTLRS